MDIDKLILKDFGHNIIRDGNAIIDSDFQIIPVSPAIDSILGGGIPEGSFVTLTGAPKSGKTTLSLYFAATCQQEQYGGRHVYYFNIEGRLKKRDLEGIPNLNKNKFTVIGSTPGNILNAEKYLSIAERYIDNVQSCVVIIDSYSALCTDAELTNDMDKMQRADTAKLIAKFCRKVANTVPVNKNIVIGVTHLMGNPTGYGAEYKEKSGQAIAYQVDVKLRAMKFTPWKINEKQMGQIVEWKCITSAIGPPGQTAISYIRYGEGVDKIYEIMTLAADIGVIEKGGAWYSYEGHKIQGLENLKQFFVKNSDLIEPLAIKTKELVK